MEPSAAAAGFGHLFSWRHPATMDLSHAAYRYNQNMMEYYTCKSKSVLYFSSIDINCLGRNRTFCILGYNYGSTTISNNCRLALKLFYLSNVNTTLVSL